MKFTTKFGTASIDQLNATMNKYKLTLVWTHTFNESTTVQNGTVTLDEDQTRAFAAQLHNYINNRAIIVGRQGPESGGVLMYTVNDDKMLRLDSDIKGSQFTAGTYKFNKADAKILLQYINTNSRPIKVD